MPRHPHQVGSIARALRAAACATAAASLIPGIALALPLDDLTAELTRPPRIVWPEGVPHPLLITQLAPRAAGDVSSPEAAARAFLGRHRALLGTPDPTTELRLAGQRAIGDGVALRFQQVFAGVPIEERTVAVWVGGDGRVRAVRLNPASRPVEAPVPALDAQDALAIALDSALGSPALWPETGHRLVYLADASPWASGARPRLAWEIHARAHPAFPADRFVYVSATTGEILLDEDRLTAAGAARVFAENPVIDGWETVQVDLSPYLVDPGLLAGVDVDGLACLDRHQLVEIDSDYGPQPVHVCTIDAAAAADGAGDFLYDPDYLGALDPFSEVTAFWHASLAVDRFAALGFTELANLPIEIVVNYQAPDGDDPVNMSDPNGTLKPVTNAYYTSGSVPGETGDHPPRIQMCQGRDADVAYDADVVYHEFTHGVVGALDGPRRSFLGPFGMCNEPSALNEAFADYYASVFTGDPHFAEYAAYKPDDEIQDGWRDLENDYDCVADVVAEAHDDGRIWAGALWRVRSGLAEGDRRAFDVAMLDAMSLMGAYAGFEIASEVALAVVRDQLGDATGDAFEDEIDRRHLRSCARWRDADGGPRSLSASGLRGLAVSGPAPGTLQLRVEASRVGGDLVVRGRQRHATGTRLHLGGYDADPNPDLRVLARRGSPVTWIPAAGMSVGVYDRDAAVLPTGEIDEHSTYEYLFYEARIPIDAAGTWYLMLASAGDSGGSLGSISIAEDVHKDVGEAPPPSRTPTLARTHPLCALSGDRGASVGALGTLALLASRALRPRRRTGARC